MCNNFAEKLFIIKKYIIPNINISRRVLLKFTNNKSTKIKKIVRPPNE